MNPVWVRTPGGARREEEPAVGLHTSWILFMGLDPPCRVAPGWLTGLGGDPSTGILGWGLLLALLPLLRRLQPLNSTVAMAAPQSPHEVASGGLGAPQ